MTGAADARAVDVALRWRAAPPALTLAAGAALALALAVATGRAQPLAFAAPLLGVLAALGLHRPTPAVRVHAEPGVRRCFEAEQTRLVLRVEPIGPGEAPPVWTVAADPAVRLSDPGDPAAPRRAVGAAAERFGRYPIRVRVEAVAAGGLLAASGSAVAAQLVVFPLAPPQRTPIPRTELLDRVGSHLTRHTGRGVEYADIRGYLPGDPLAAVNWPVSARRGRLHVTERLTDRGADVVVLIDSYPQPTGPATAALQRAVHGATQVVQSALRTGDRAAVVLLGAGRPRWLAADLGQRQFYRILDAVLGGDEPPPPTRTETLAPAPAIPPAALVVAFSTLLDAEFSLALTDLRNRGHAVLAVDVLAGPPFPDQPDPLLGRLWALQRAAMYRDMATIGVDVLAWPDGWALDQAMAAGADPHRPVRR